MLFTHLGNRDKRACKKARRETTSNTRFPLICVLSKKKGRKNETHKLAACP